MQTTMSNIAMTDREIITLQRNGRHEKAFNAIVDSYSERLYWHIRRFLGSHDDTNDLLQDIFLKIWKGLPSFRGDAQIYTWVYRIATNEALTYLRRNNGKADIDIEALARKIDDDPYFNGDSLQRELHKAIRSLPEKQQLVFNLRYFDEMKYEDMAAVTGTSVGALKASYHHAYNKIREKLEKIFIQ